LDSVLLVSVSVSPENLSTLSFSNMIRTFLLRLLTTL
jgi:hypothetical protein